MSKQADWILEGYKAYSLLGESEDFCPYIEVKYSNISDSIFNSYRRACWLEGWNKAKEEFDLF